MPAPPDLLLTLSAPVLRSLLAALGHDAPASAKSSHALVKSLFERAPSRKVASGLAATVARFSPARARLALVEAARATGDARAEALLAEPAPDVAPRLVVERENAKKPAARRAIKKLFALAAHRVERDLPERPTYELVADAPVTGDADAIAARLREALGARVVDAWTGVDASGAPKVALFLRQPTESRLVLDESASTPRIVEPTGPSTSPAPTPNSGAAHS
jgi:hypothetical protein